MTVLKYLISEEQECGVKGKTILEKPVLLREMIGTVNERNKLKHEHQKEGSSLDRILKKTYDVINHRYLKDCLQKVWFPQKVIDCIGGIINNMKNKVMVNYGQKKSRFK